MIVDVHTYIWESQSQLGEPVSRRLRENLTYPWERLDASPDAHEAATQAVDYAFVLGFTSRLLGADLNIKATSRYVRPRRGKLLGFAGVDPSQPDCVEQLNEARALNFVGVTLSPTAQGVAPNDSRALRICDWCCQAGWPIIFNTAGIPAPTSRLELSQPYLLDEVARSFSGLKILITHFGWPWIDQAITLLSKHRNIYADLALVNSHPRELYNVLIKASEHRVLDRVLLGSGFPFATAREAIAGILNVNALVAGTSLPQVPHQELSGIVHRDALGCLGLKGF